MVKKYLIGLFVIALAMACKKDENKQLRYFEVVIVDNPSDWRDSSFIIATADPQLISEINTQLSLPIPQRKIINGALQVGSGGYNKNGSHEFKWHFKEDDWHFTDLSIEIYDGRPYSDLDLDLPYWLNTIKRFSPWNSYIKREINQ